MPFEEDKLFLPEYPRTRHLPYQPNATRDDLIASESDAKIIFGEKVSIEEKVDGANVGFALIDDQPVIRNRNHILRKGYEKATAAKKQFAPIWTWFYEHLDNFLQLAEIAPGTSVFGEWLVAVHSICYTELPSYFIAFDLYDYDAKRFLDPFIARQHLQSADFITTPLLADHIGSYPDLAKLCQQPSIFAPSERREGVYLKIGDGQYLTHRFKMVRKDFIQGGRWDKKHLTKNTIKK